MTETDELRECTKCKQLMPVTEFYKNIRNKDGLQWNCKQCCSAENKRRYRSLSSEAYANLLEKRRLYHRAKGEERKRLKRLWYRNLSSEAYANLLEKRRLYYRAKVESKKAD